MSDWKQIVEFAPAYDKRNPDPSKNYGIHGVELRFILKGKKGAVQFVLFTNWMLPHVQEEQEAQHVGHTFCHPMPADLGYHSHNPTYEGQKSITENCPYLDGHKCYYDGSGLNAERIYKVLLQEGDKGVWQQLGEYYNQVFEGGPR